jgi:predicted Rossmann fold flavoprotein
MSTPLPEKTDVLIIGAGAAGLMCAITAGQRARSVLVVEHANKVGKKILMSGGGRCNFTNIHTEAHHFVSQNAHFCKSALSRFGPDDFIALVNKHKIANHEKKWGQLFCNNKSRDILDMLLQESQKAGVKVRTHCSIEKVKSLEDGFELVSNLGKVKCHSLVVASGGLSIPKMGATAFGYKLASQFGLDLVPSRAGLVPFTLDKIVLDKLVRLSGSSLEVVAKCKEMSFRGNLLFTHRGLSGPVILQISSYWQPGDELIINLLPDTNLLEVLLERQQFHPKSELKSILARFMSKNMSLALIDLWFGELSFGNKPISQFTNSQLQSIAEHFRNWKLKPSGTEGYRTAEVTLGGVNTNELSSKTMESVKRPGLYFIGEVVDVTGQLGGFNFQWAWASGVAAGGYV